MASSPLHGPRVRSFSNMSYIVPSSPVVGTLVPGTPLRCDSEPTGSTSSVTSVVDLRIRGSVWSQESFRPKDVEEDTFPPPPAMICGGRWTPRSRHRAVESASEARCGRSLDFTCPKWHCLTPKFLHARHNKENIPRVYSSSPRSVRRRYSRLTGVPSLFRSWGPIGGRSARR
jgi:hypothetical protein